MAQFARPSSTISAGSWTAINEPTLHEATDEVPATVDSTEASSTNAGTDVLEMALSAISTPAAGTVTMRWTARKGATGGETIQQRVDLLEGTTIRATFGPTSIADSTTFSIHTYALSTAERDSITNWGNLRVRITRTDLGGSNRNLRIGAFELEAPDAAGGGAVSVDQAVPSQTLSLTQVAVSPSTGASHSVPVQVLGLTQTPSTPSTGVNHILSPLALSLASTGVTVALSANVDVATQVLQLLQTPTAVELAGDVAIEVSPQIINLAQAAVDIALGTSFAVPTQQITVTPVAPVVSTGVNHELTPLVLALAEISPEVGAGTSVVVPVQLINLLQTETVVDTASVVVAVGPLILRLSTNNGQPVSMLLTRIQNGIVTRERYRFPLG